LTPESLNAFSEILLCLGLVVEAQLQTLSHGSAYAEIQENVYAEDFITAGKR
jgi:hypothetical protein